MAAALRATDVRVQWNLSIVLGRLPLKGRDKAVVVDLMFERLRDKSGLNRTVAMQALMDLSEKDAALRARVMPIVREALEGMAARLAATSATDAEVAQLRAAVTDNVAALNGDEGANMEIDSRHDQDFHFSIARLAIQQRAIAEADSIFDCLRLHHAFGQEPSGF